MPTSPNQVAYARNVLDWPTGDSTGNVRRTVDTTFATGQTGVVPASESNGDLRLVPLVEVQLPVAEASKLFSATASFSTTRTLLGYRETTTTTVVWLTATVDFSAQGANTLLTLTSLRNLTNTNETVTAVKILPDANCVVLTDTVQYTPTVTGGGPGTVVTIPTPFTNLFDGQHAVVLEKQVGNETHKACLLPGDVPNGGLATGLMYDPAPLAAYGMTLRDLPDTAVDPAPPIELAKADTVFWRLGNIRLKSPPLTA